MNKREINKQLKELKDRRVLYVQEMQTAMSMMGKLLVKRMIAKLDAKAEKLTKLKETLK